MIQKKSLFDCFTLSHCFFIIWWKELNSMPKYAIWKCKLHLNDDSNFFTWPFDFSSSFSCQLFDIFAHFFPCYLFKTICFFYLRSFFFFFTKSRCMPFAKKENASSWKLQRKSLTTFFVMVNKRLFSVEWINHTNNHKRSKQMSNSLNF